MVGPMAGQNEGSDFMMPEEAKAGEVSKVVIGLVVVVVVVAGFVVEVVFVVEEEMAVDAMVLGER